MTDVLRQLRSGDWKSLLACFLYFDTGFTVWVMYGPLAQSISQDLDLAPTQKAFLTAVPILSAALLRVTFGNLFQAIDGRRLSLCGILLSAIPPMVLLSLPGTPSLPLLLVLGVLLGVGGASFAVALPMAGSGYPPRVQGLVLGLCAAGNIGAVVNGSLFPGLAEHVGWQRAVGAALPLLGLAAGAMLLWGRDRSPKCGNVGPAAGAFGFSIAALMGLVLLIHAGLFGLGGRTGMLLMPVIGAVIVVAVLPARYRAVFTQRDACVLMLVYAITFGGFVGMSSFVSPLLIDLYAVSMVEAGGWMAVLAFTGAMIRPIGGLVADRVSGVRALLVLLAGIAACDLAMALLQPGRGLALVLLFAMYACFGLGNGATFQLVARRWPAQGGLMSGVIGAAGGIGGFYLPMVLGTTREALGSYWIGFAVFGAVAAACWLVVVALRRQWLAWAMPEDAPPPDDTDDDLDGLLPEPR